LILVDTSVWVDHLHKGLPALAEVLARGQVMTHPFVIGELACGRLTNRRMVLHLLKALPAAPMATDEETLLLIERQNLMGKGIGYIDAHLLASVILGGDVELWTRDKRLVSIATHLKVAFSPA
jgi:predicted nucleic acid-binding protein